MEKLLQYRFQLKLDHCANALETLITEKRAFLDQAKGNFLKYRQVLEHLPDFSPSHIDLTQNTIAIGEPSDVTAKDIRTLTRSLMQLCPWRKGPFRVFGIDVDSEWQSWMKWDRLKHHISDLGGRRVLDIGSSNGYYMFRMAAAHPRMVLGLEPQSAFYYQYLALQKYLRNETVFCLPIPHDQLPRMDRYFDTVFCMGVLYHRKSPIQMLTDIWDTLKKGGELVLENLILNTHSNLCLFPKDRYAKMRNVFFIPDLLTMESWLLRAGFTNIRCVDIAPTSFDEQRKTKWIQTETLSDFLDPADSQKTIEGYPAPVRAIFIAQAT